MAVHSDAQEDQIETTAQFDRFFESQAMRIEQLFGDVAIQAMHLLGRQVHMLGQVLSQPSLVRLRAVGRQSIVLVEQKQLDAAKVEGFLAVQADQFAESRQGGRTGRQADDGSLAQSSPFADQSSHDVGGVMGQFLDGIETERG